MKRRESRLRGHAALAGAAAALRRLRLLLLQGPLAGPALAHRSVVRPHDHRPLRPPLRDRRRAEIHAGGDRAGDRGEPDWSAEWTGGKTTAADALRNPLRPGGESRGLARRARRCRCCRASVEAAGDTLYQNFCTVCHGVAGDAKGPVSSRIGAPSLLTGRARGYSDGYLYSIIRYGRGVMPRYGDKVYQPGDRWAIVSHIRKLQAASPAPQEPAGAAVGIPPAPSATGSTGGRPR